MCFWCDWRHISEKCMRVMNDYCVEDRSTPSNPGLYMSAIATRMAILIVGLFNSSPIIIYKNVSQFIVQLKYGVGYRMRSRDL